MRPTYLYIKQHAKTGLKYFGKTVQNDPVKYLGSGSYWTKHIKKYGIEYVKTLCFALYLDEESLQHDAIQFSKDNDIVKSKKWANLKEEDGINNSGGRGHIRTEEQKKRISDGLLGKKHSPERIENTRKALIGVKRGPHSEQWKQRIRESNIGIKRSSETCQRLGDKARGTRWINNGIIEKQTKLIDDYLPEGWSFGRIKFKNKKGDN